MHRRRRRLPTIPLELLAATLHWAGLWAVAILAWALAG
jgi:hypothetical protein